MDQDLRKIMEQVGDHATTGKYQDRNSIAKWEDIINPQTKQVIRDNALQFISDNMNHLPMYYVPGTEFK